jgi:hypothetical protein
MNERQIKIRSERQTPRQLFISSLCGRSEHVHREQQMLEKNKEGNPMMKQKIGK